MGGDVLVLPGNFWRGFLFTVIRALKGAFATEWPRRRSLDHLLHVCCGRLLAQDGPSLGDVAHARERRSDD